MLEIPEAPLVPTSPMDNRLRKDAKGWFQSGKSGSALVSLYPELARYLITHPCEAAEDLMGAEMDVFQRARFRYWWFCPTVMDHSGVSVGKSEMMFFLAFLRLITLPLPYPRKPRIVTVYYPSQGTAEEVLLPKIEACLSHSNLFNRQVRRGRGGAWLKTKKNVFVVEMRDGGWLEIPAGDFMRDSQNQASKRFNDGLFDEVSKMDALGDGVSKELLQRNTRECFNPKHPVHANKTLFLAHAESPSHPYFKRYDGLVKKIRAGSQDHVVLTSSYRDFRGVFFDRYGQTPAKRAADQQGGDLDDAEMRQLWYGEWAAGTKGVYPEFLRDGITRKGLLPEMRRSLPSTLYALGWDTATGTSRSNDLSAGVVLGADRYPERADDLPGWMEVNGTWWKVRSACAVFLDPGADVDQKSGLIHHLHLLFDFAVLMLDNRGGGGEVAMKLREARQFVRNEWKQVRGLCRPDERHAWPMADPLVHFYDRGEPLLAPWFGERFVKDNAGPVDYAHREVRAMMRRGEFCWPPQLGTFSETDRQRLDPEVLFALSELERVLREFGNISVAMDRKGNPLFSEKGFQRYTHTRKKDGAMAAIYALIGLRAKIAEMFPLKEKRQDGDETGIGFY